MPFGFESCRFVPALRSLVHTCHEIFSSKMRVALEHLHGLVTANSGYLLVRKSGLHETADGFMAKIMKPKIGHALLSFDRLPHAIELIGTPLSVSTRLSKKD